MSALQKILVVDDDPVVGKSFSRVLSNKGYAVITAANAQEALAKLDDDNYDMVYTDIRMEGMDGLALAERVKASQPWMPVVIVTGYGTAASEQRAKAAGVSAFLLKPLTPEMIEGSAANALNPAAAVVVELPAAARDVPAIPATVATVEADGLAKKVALLLAAPLIGLLYFLLFPVIGMVMLASVAIGVVAKVPAARKAMTFLKNAGLFFAAPFVGLAYVLMFPFIGLGIAAATAWKALNNVPAAAPAIGFLKFAGTLIAAPFLGLAFIVTFPFVGMALLVRIGFSALASKIASAE